MRPLPSPRATRLLAPLLLLAAPLGGCERAPEEGRLLLCTAGAYGQSFEGELPLLSAEENPGFQTTGYCEEVAYQQLTFALEGGLSQLIGLTMQDAEGNLITPALDLPLDAPYDVRYFISPSYQAQTLLLEDDEGLLLAVGAERREPSGAADALAGLGLEVSAGEVYREVKGDAYRFAYMPLNFRAGGETLTLTPMEEGRLSLGAHTYAVWAFSARDHAELHGDDFVLGERLWALARL